MPGGPNSKVTEPPTTPPPMTRSSSLTPVGMGRAAVAETPASETAPSPRSAPTTPARRETRPCAGSAASVFHSPQAGQRPTQRNDVVPHSWHA